MKTINIGISGSPGGGNIVQNWTHGPINLFGVQLHLEFYGAATTTLVARAIVALESLNLFDSDASNYDVFARAGATRGSADGGTETIFVPLYGLYVPADKSIYVAATCTGDAAVEVQAVLIYEQSVK